MDDRQKILAYRQVLRNSLERLVHRFWRDSQVGRERLPADLVAEMLHQIHCQYLELLRYSQMVVADYALLMEDERLRADAMQRAMRGAVLSVGAKRAAEMALAMSANARTSHPEIKLEPVAVGDREVLL